MTTTATKNATQVWIETYLERLDKGAEAAKNVFGGTLPEEMVKSHQMVKTILTDLLNGTDEEQGDKYTSLLTAVSVLMAGDPLLGLLLNATSQKLRKCHVQARRGGKRRSPEVITQEEVVDVALAARLATVAAQAVEGDPYGLVTVALAIIVGCNVTGLTPEKFHELLLKHDVNSGGVAINPWLLGVCASISKAAIEASEGNALTSGLIEEAARLRAEAPSEPTPEPEPVTES